MKKFFVFAFSISFLALSGFVCKTEAGEIPGCYQKLHGQLRIVDNHSQCLDSELPIFLNAAFVQEPQEPLMLKISIKESENGENEEPEEGVGSFSLVETGNAFFVAHGVFDPVPSDSDPDDKPVLFSGTCQVFEDCMEGQSHPMLFCNLSQTQEHAEKSIEGDQASCQWFDGRMVQIILDLTTLSGNVWNVGIDYKKVFISGEFRPDYSSFNGGYDSGTVSVVGGLPQCLLRYVE